MLSKIPIQLGAVPREELDREILRAAVMAELDAINLYEQMASLVRNPDIRDILLDVAREEKTHVGEFQALLLREDPQYAAEILAGEREVREKADGTKHVA